MTKFCVKALETVILAALAAATSCLVTLAVTAYFSK